MPPMKRWDSLIFPIEYYDVMFESNMKEFTFLIKPSVSQFLIKQKIPAFARILYFESTAE